MERLGDVATSGLRQWQARSGLAGGSGRNGGDGSNGDTALGVTTPAGTRPAVVGAPSGAADGATT